jgi:hypothetical protein
MREYGSAMLTARQFCIAVASVDVVLFLVATAFNDHSNTSADGIVWWAALGVFVALVAIGLVIVGRYAWTRRRRPGRGRRRSGSRM